MRDDGVVEFEFEELGLQYEGAEIGLYAGTASIDQDGGVVGLTLDGYVTCKSRPLGPPDRVSRYLPIPAPNKTVLSFDEQLARKLADAIETGYVPEINDLLNDWHVSLAERAFDEDDYRERRQDREEQRREMIAAGMDD